MRIPDWAPAALRNLWEERGELMKCPDELMTVLNRYPAWELGSVIRPEMRDENVRLLERLITDPRMKFVWEKLAARAADDKPYDVMLFLELQKCAADWEYEPKDSAAEKKKHLKSVFDQAKKLANTLIDSRHIPTTRVADLMKDSEVIACANEVDQEDADEGESFAEINSTEPAETAEWVRDRVLEFLPPLEILLVRLAQLAQFEANIPPVVKQPRSPNARLHYFVRQVSAY